MTSCLATADSQWVAKMGPRVDTSILMLCLSSLLPQSWCQTIQFCMKTLKYFVHDYNAGIGWPLGLMCVSYTILVHSQQLK